MLLVKLIHRITNSLKLNNLTNIFLWFDSMIFLSLIIKEPYQLKTFVANRIAAIQELTTSDKWNYVPSEDKPEDFVSKGMDPSKMKSCELWWDDLAFLMN
ncbi:uncharacterized protein NPIL_406261 [Nephila pilipes]|uniref:Uncharacterized protein n=1 Tax=Nephila pilipes TaxID=299642 RepID=A0A8X6Q9U1_NEPPI|nr:uncharacterized protein NPIL_406261 [Nephila pilipes]